MINNHEYDSQLKGYFNEFELTWIEVVYIRATFSRSLAKQFRKFAYALFKFKYIFFIVKRQKCFKTLVIDSFILIVNNNCIKLVFII